MDISLISLGAAALYFLGMLGALDIGRRIGMRRMSFGPDATRGTGAIEGAVFALLGLLIAFTFTNAAQRFESRRQLVADEANAIGTALLRLDLLPPEASGALHLLFRDYLGQRLEVHRLLPDIEAALEAEVRADALQEEIWTLAVQAAQQDGRPQVATIVLPALNEMFDLANLRLALARAHVPLPILGMLLVLSLLAALLAGHSMATPLVRSWLHVLVFAALLSATMYLIVDLEFPRVGFININAADVLLEQLQDSLR